MGLSEEVDDRSFRLVHVHVLDSNWNHTIYKRWSIARSNAGNCIHTFLHSFLYWNHSNQDHGLWILCWLECTWSFPILHVLVVTILYIWLDKGFSAIVYSRTQTWTHYLGIHETSLLCKNLWRLWLFGINDHIMCLRSHTIYHIIYDFPLGVFHYVYCLKNGDWSHCWWSTESQLLL